MNKLSLTISGLTDYTPKRRAELVEYLSETFSISPEILAMKLQSFPVTFPNWVAEDQLESVKTSLENLGAVVELGEATASLAPAESDQKKSTAEDDSVASEPNTSPSITESDADLDSLSFDASSEDLSSAKDTDFEPKPTVSEASGDFSLSFDDDSGQTDESTSAPAAPTAPAAPVAPDEPTQVELSSAEEDNAAQEPALDFGSLDFNDSAKEPEPTAHAKAVDDKAAEEEPLSTEAFAGFATIDDADSVEEEDSCEVRSDLSAEAEEAAPNQEAAEETTLSEGVEKNLSPASEALEAPPAQQDYDVEIDEEELELLGYQEGPSKATLALAGFCIVVIASLATFIFMMDYQPSDGLAVDNEVISSIVKQQQRMAEAKKKAVKKKPEGPGEERWTGDLDLEGIKTSVLFDTKNLVLTDIRLEISTPPPAKLTVDELVEGKAQPVWLNKFVIERLESYEAFDPSKPGKTEHKISKFNLQIKGKAYMRDHGGRGRRILADITLTGEVAPDGNSVKGEWRIANGEPGEAALPKNSAKYLSGKSYRLFYEGAFRAKKEEKPKEAEEKSSKKKNVKAKKK